MILNMKIESMYKFYIFEILIVIKYGIGVVKNMGEEVVVFGVLKVFFVIDSGIYKVGVVDLVIELFKEVGIEVVFFNKVELNLFVCLVNEGFEFYKKENCNGLVVVGGGSFMDIVKVIGVEVIYEGSVLDYEVVDGKKLLENCIFLLMIILIMVGIGLEVI